MKTDLLGAVEWTQAYGGTGYDGGNVIQQTTDGGFIVAGYTDSWGAGQEDVYLIKTDSTGNMDWTRVYGGTSRDLAFAVQQTSDGGFIVAGKTMSFGAGIDDFYVLRTDGLGDTLWTATYGGPFIEQAHGCREMSNGDFIIAGYSSSFGAGINDVFVIRIDSVGDVVWARTYGGSQTDY